MPHLITRRLRAAARDERGSALVAVVGIVLVALVIAATISATTVSALDRTDDTRDTVTADYAAEAGVSVVQADIEAGRCATHGPVYLHGGSAPYFRAVVLRETASGEQRGCPAAREEFRILSTGYSSPADFSAAAASEPSSVEARYEEVPVPFLPSGPAVFSYGDIDLSQRTTIVAEAGLEPSVMSYDGDVTCVNSSSGPADVIVRNGDLDVENSCLIAGSAWVSGAADVYQSGRVEGDLVAASITTHNPQSYVGRSWIRGTAGAPPAPLVPTWADVDLNASDWPAYTIRTLTTCTGAGVGAAITAFAGHPGVIDARSCPPITLPNQLSVALTANVAVFANGFTIGGVTVTGAPGSTLWLITPDRVVDQRPTCGATASGTVTETEIGNNAVFQGVQVMFYTPCTITIEQLAVKGQLYAQDVIVRTNVTLDYTPSGLPGYNLDTGAATSPTKRTLTSYLDTTERAETHIP